MLTSGGAREVKYNYFDRRVRVGKVVAIVRGMKTRGFTNLIRNGSKVIVLASLILSGVSNADEFDLKNISGKKCNDVGNSQLNRYPNEAKAMQILAAYARGGALITPDSFDANKLVASSISPGSKDIRISAVMEKKRKEVVYAPTVEVFDHWETHVVPVYKTIEAPAQ